MPGNPVNSIQNSFPALRRVVTNHILKQRDPVEGTACYDLFGLTFESQLPIPGLARQRSGGSREAVSIEFGPVPHTIARADYRDETVQASAAEFLYSYPNVIRLYVEGGTRIVAEPLEACDRMALWSFILGMGASVAGLRRGFVALHAAAVADGSRCIAFAGQSGAGKSTLAASLVDLGFSLHADDLCLMQPGLRQESDGAVMVGPGIRELRLCDDAVASLKWSAREPYGRLAAVAKSVYLLKGAQPATLPLGRIYLLEFSNAATPPGIYPVDGVAGLRALIDVLRLRPTLLRTGDKQAIFQALAQICRSVPIFRFVRPRDATTMRVWSERLAEHFSDTRKER